MPYGIQKVAEGKYQVINLKTGQVHAKHTSKTKADAQVRLLEAVDHGFTPSGKKKKQK